MKYKVKDNLLDINSFKRMQEKIISDHTPWFFQESVEFPKTHKEYKEDKNSYFSHLIFDKKINSSLFEIILPILDFIKYKALIRIKLNLYPRTEKIIIHKPHKDYEYKHKGAIFYFNTNNGKTILENKIQIDSRENRILLFDPSKPHQSTSTTDTKARINMNINYF
jgi:hypothetical protein